MDSYAGRAFEPQTLHKYLYTHGNPENGVDPSGYFGISDLMSAINVRVIQASQAVGSFARILDLAERSLTIVEAL